MARVGKHFTDDKKGKREKKLNLFKKEKAVNEEPEGVDIFAVKKEEVKKDNIIKRFFTGTKKQVAGRCVLALFCIGFLSVVLMTGITAFRIGRINMESLYQNIERSSNLYDISGEQFDTLHYTEDREIVSIEDMPENLGNAFIAVEDKTFYKHHGFNFRRMAGAVLSKLLGRSDAISGTSTITQQLARNAYLADIKSQRSIRRKLSEMYIAWRLEHKLTKDQILEAYLNTIYLGYGNYGVGAAARTYFSKDVDELDLAECAALAALPQAPDSYALITTEEGEADQELTDIHYYTLDEINDEDEEEDSGYEAASYDSYDEEEEEDSTGYYANDTSKDRRDLVLSLMEEQGYISQDEADAAVVDIIDILKPSFEKSDSAYTYFKDYISQVITQDLVDKYGMSEEEAQRMVYTGGLEIYTTLNSELQNIIYDEFQNDANFPSAVDGSEVQASMVVTQVGTGYISALVGGRDAGGSQLFNRAISPRQPGSSIKPLSVYGAALQKSFEYEKKGKTFQYTDYGYDTQGVKGWGDYITASSLVIDEPMKVNGKEWPQNVTRSYSGRNTLRRALQQSINTCAVKILWQVGLDYSMEMAEKFGLTTLVSDTSKETNDVNPAALGLGAMAYGVTPLEMALAYAAFPNGGELNSPVSYIKITDSSGKKLLTGKSETTKVLDEGVAWIMTDLLKSVVSRGIAGSAAISGVEVGGKTGTTNDTFDVWFDGFTPDYAGALWIGTDLNVEMLGGSSQAARLWGKIMGQLTGIRDGEYRDMPSDVVKTGGEYYTKGTDKNLSGYRDSYGSGSSNKKSGSDDKKEDEDKKKASKKKSDSDEDDDSGSGGSGGGSGDSGSSTGGGSSVSGGGSPAGGTGGGSSDSGSGGSGGGGSSDSGSGGSGGGSSDSGSGGSGGGSSDSGSGGSGGGGSSDSGSGGSGGGSSTGSTGE